ncbi:hypothetical protein AB4Z18_02465 [Leifsonia sp. 2TAF2]
MRTFVVLLAALAATTALVLVVVKASDLAEERDETDGAPDTI